MIWIQISVVLWQRYIDDFSAFQEVNESQIDLNSAYMLFYQRDGLSVDKYMPNVEGKVPYPKELDEEGEAEYKKQCVVM